MKFYNRKEEMDALGKALILSKSKLVLVTVTGRRRIGKTRLVREFLSSKRLRYLDFFFSVKSERLLLDDFSREIELKLGYSPKFENFQDFLRYIERINVDAIFFDEFQNVLKINPSMASDLQAFIDRNSDLPLLLIISGSYLGMMKRLFAQRKAPLYGRSTLFMELSPLRPSAVFQMLSDLGVGDPQEKIVFYGLFGGVPKYYELLELFGPKPPLELIADAVRYSSFITSEGEGLLLDEFGKAYKTYYSILKAISIGRNRLVEIANAVGMKPGSISKYLDALENYYGLISREEPVLNGKRSRYVIKDYFLNFWFSMIEPWKAAIDSSDYEPFFRALEVDFPGYFGRVFERIVSDILRDLNGKLLTFDLIGPQWGRNYEIDLVAVNTKGKEATFIEAKWRDNVDGPREIGRLIAKSQNVPWNGKRKYLLIAKGFRVDCNDCLTAEELVSLLESLKYSPGNIQTEI